MFDEEYGKKIVPRSEISERIECLRYQMSRDKILATLVISRTNYFYFGGTSQNAILFVPLEEDPILFVKRDIDRARKESPLPIIYGFQSVTELPTLIKAHIRTLPSTLGIELDVLPAQKLFYFERIFKGTAFVNVSMAIMKCKMKKSAFELDQIRNASRIARHVFEYGKDILKPGMTEIEFAARLELEAKMKGNEGLIRMRGLNNEGYSWHVLSGPSGAVLSDGDTPSGGWGLSPAFPMGAGCRRIQPHEPILVDFPVCYNGYVADQTRMFCVGELPEKFLRAYEFCRRVEARVMEKARPKVECEEIFLMTERMAQESGYENTFLGPPGKKSQFVGHGVGLEVNELPVFGAKQCYPLESGVVVAVEPKVVFQGEGVVGIENMYRITDDGYERLTCIDDSVFQVKYQ